jgi:hypothetical protein
VLDVAQPASEHTHAKAARGCWVRLLKRVFAIDVKRCACGGILEIIAAIENPFVIVMILTRLGLQACAAAPGSGHRAHLCKNVFSAARNGTADQTQTG